MDRRELELSRPCPIDLDSLGVDRTQRRVFCSHCSAHVTDISKMREAEAVAFVAAKRGSGVCISYLCDSEGKLHFADSEPAGAELGAEELGAEEAKASMSLAPPDVTLVPEGRLRRRRPTTRRAAAVAALALAACTPHGEHEPYGESADDVVMEWTIPNVSLAEQPSELKPVLKDRVEQVGEAPEGTNLAEEICDAEAKTKAKTGTKTGTETTQKKRHRGTLRRSSKIVPDLDRIDGGI